MTYQRYGFRPYNTPKAISVLIWITCIVSILAALLEPLFHYFFQTSTSHFLGLSVYGFTHYYFWQVITFLFLQPSGGVITFGFILSLLFNMYLLWVIGALLLERLGSSRFVLFYLGSGVFAGLCALAILYLSGLSAIIAGPAPAIYALLILWAMLYPETDLLFFFLFPIKAKWLVVGLLSIIALMSFSQGDLISFITLFAGSFFGYFYALMVLDIRGPFEKFHTFEEKISEGWQGLKRLVTLQTFSRKKKSGSSSSAKIFDFKTGEPLVSDEEFLESMLTKISRHGEKSLTAEERHRMDRISQGKFKKNPKQ